MDELKLFLEGIENKIKRLLIKQKALTEQVSRLNAEKADKDHLIKEQQERIEELEKKIEVLGAAKVLSHCDDNTNAKHKIEEILRDIDNCLVILNR